MAIPLSIQYSREIQSPRSDADVFAYLSNWEESIPSNFPGMESFKKIGSDQYHWTFEKFAHSGKEMQISFSTEFRKSPTKLEMIPVPNSGTAALKGSWALAKSNTGTLIRFQAELELELPLPGFLKSMVAPIATKELQKLFDSYVHRLEKTLR